MFMYGFSCLRFLSRFSKTGLGIVPFGGTRELHTYTFKQPILAAAAFQAAFSSLRASLARGTVGGFSTLSPPDDAPVSVARDAPEGVAFR
jgi:hypothetical protein